MKKKECIRSFSSLLNQRFYFTATFLFGFLLTACSSSSPTFRTADGKTLRLRDYNGQWLVVNYWASWCGPCRQEMAALNAFSQQERGRVLVLGVNYDGLQEAALQKAVADLQIHFPVLSANPQNTLHLQAVDVMPAIFLLNPQHQVVKLLVGPQTVRSLTDAIKKNT